jgi:hypothetical protein
MQLLERKINTYLSAWKNNPKRKPGPQSPGFSVRKGIMK